MTPVTLSRKIKLALHLPNIAFLYTIMQLCLLCIHYVTYSTVCTMYIE
jgi:hypothetical protein